MSYKLTKEHFRSLLDAMNITHKVDSDGDFVAPLSADEDCRYDVRVIFCVEDTAVQSLAFAAGLEIQDNKISEAMLFCNDWNKSKKGPKSYVDIKNKTFIAECVTWTDVEISDEFIKENVIRLWLGLSWSFYKEVAKQF